MSLTCACSLVAVQCMYAHLLFGNMKYIWCHDSSAYTMSLDSVYTIFSALPAAAHLHSRVSGMSSPHSASARVSESATLAECSDEHTGKNDQGKLESASLTEVRVPNAIYAILHDVSNAKDCLEHSVHAPNLILRHSGSSSTVPRLCRIYFRSSLIRG